MADLKYPRTYHLPTSPGLGSDDRRIPSLAIFQGNRVIITEKMDGECTTLTRDRAYARSPDSGYHPSRDWLRAFHAPRARDIPEGYRLTGEYLYARHAVPYTRAAGNALESFFYGFAAWNESDELLDWDSTRELLELLEITPVPVLYDGVYSDRIVAERAGALNTELQEGLVVRLAEAMPYPPVVAGGGRFFEAVAKWVRPAHVTAARHWMAGPLMPNELRDGIAATP